MKNGEGGESSHSKNQRCVMLHQDHTQNKVHNW